MKQPKHATKAHTPGKPLDPQQFPLNAQAEPTAGRDKVREQAYPVRAPRQTERPVERTGKRRSGT